MLIHEDRTEMLAERYDSRAAVYDEIWAPILEAVGSKLVANLSETAARSVLDVGTGVGTMLPHLQRAFPDASVLGVDRSPGMLARAPRRFRGPVMDARNLSFDRESVDLVTTFFMLFHLPDPLDGIREARRVLRPGGRLGAITWGPGTLESEAMLVWRRCLDDHGADTPEPEYPSSLDQLDTPEKVESILVDGGFRSARAWSEELVAVIPADELLRLRTKMGVSSDRYRSLGPDAGKACMDDARERLRMLPQGAFVARGPLVCAVAHA